MRTFLVVFTMLVFASSAFAQMSEAARNNLPKGVFKKNSRGQIVQYDNKGKKIGVYRTQSGRLVKIK